VPESIARRFKCTAFNEFLVDILPSPNFLIFEKLGLTLPHGKPAVYCDIAMP
jgi:hypothetical protein